VAGVVGHRLGHVFMPACKLDSGISLASFLRFWAVAARRNSSRAPFGPRSSRDLPCHIAQTMVVEKREVLSDKLQPRSIGLIDKIYSL
jgi:hypothetical protein